MVKLIASARHSLGPDVILMTTDGGSVGYMTRGSINGSSVRVRRSIKGRWRWSRFRLARRTCDAPAMGCAGVHRTCGEPNEIKKVTHTRLLQCYIAGLFQVYTVGDGCGNPEACDAAQKEFNPPGMSPMMCSECYTGART